MNNLTKEKLERIDAQLEEQQRTISFSMKEFTTELYVNKYITGEDEDENELYIPDYQREFIWDIKHQSRFIESLLLGLPVPFIFAAEIKETGRLEIVDGSQRIRTIAAFMQNKFVLNYLEKLTELNGCRFEQMSVSLQRKFKNISIRMITLSDKATEDVRNELFDRINTSSVPLLPMETRRGIYKGPFTDLIAQLAKNPRFIKLCPLPQYFQNRREEEELLLRLFAFVDVYPIFTSVESKGVSKFLDNYLAEQNSKFTEDKKNQCVEMFNKLIDFMNCVYAGQGFAKRPGVCGISKPYFEAIAVGITLALRENPNLLPVVKEELKIDKKKRNAFYEILEGRYQTHTAEKIKNRIDYVKNAYLHD